MSAKQQLPQNYDDLMSIFLALSLTDSNTLGKPVQADGKETGVFHFETSASQRGPFYDLIVGNPQDSNFGKSFTLRVSLSRTYVGNYSTSFGFYQLANNAWMFAENVNLTGVPASRMCPEEVSKVINNIFAQFFTSMYGTDSVPEQYVEDIEQLVVPQSEKTDLYTALEKDRQEKERQQQLLEQELKVRQEAIEAAYQAKVAEEKARQEKARQEAERIRAADAARQEAARQEAERIRKEAEAARARISEAEAARVRIAEAARQEAARVAEAARQEAARVAQTASNKVVATKHFFFRVLKANNVPAEGTLGSKTLTDKDWEFITTCMAEQGRDTVAGWWAEYKTPKSKVDF